MFTGTPGHLHTFNYLGEYGYFLTFCTYQRHRAFIDGDKVEVVSTQILRAAAQERFALTAYCYMPDHLHLLAEGRVATSDCRRFIARAKQFSGFHYQRTSAERLWQRYGYERVLRADEETLSVARYIPDQSRSCEECAGVSVYWIERVHGRGNPGRIKHVG